MKSFTLIESLITIFIFGLASAALFGFFLILYKTHGYQWQQSLAILEARKGIETMVKEIREAKEGDDGSYPIEKAGDKEFIFYSDIDNDGKTERVRYFLGTVSSGSQTLECQTFVKGGSCGVQFSNFLEGNLISAQLKISLDGDFGAGSEYAEIFADGSKLGDVCKFGCSDCPGTWQGATAFDVKPQAADNFVSFLADATFQVDPSCPHSMKAKFELSWTEDLTSLSHEFKKGVIKPELDATGKIFYPPEKEKISILTSYVRNTPPIFEYLDQYGNKIEDYPARLSQTKVMKVFLVVNVNPNRPPTEFQLESFVQLRNLKQE